MTYRIEKDLLEKNTFQRVGAPGGIQWVEYPETNVAICDGLDRSLIMTMKLEMIKLVRAGRKEAIKEEKFKGGDIIIKSVGEMRAC